MLPWLRVESHELDEAILYNQLTVGDTNLDRIAAACGYCIGTPDPGKTPLDSGAREQYWRELKRRNQKLRFGAYTSLNTGMRAVVGAFGNQPFHDNELGPILVKHPDLAMRDEQGNILIKGGGDDTHEPILINPGYPKAGG
jgi:hypothetical protein